MKKLKEAIDKYLVHLIFLAIIAFGGFIWDYAARFFNLPAKIERLESQHRQDSLSWVRQYQTNKRDSLYLEEDYKNIKKLLNETAKGN